MTRQPCHQYKVIPHSFRTKMLRALIGAVLREAEGDGAETYYKVAAGDFTLRIGE